MENDRHTIIIGLALVSLPHICLPLVMGRIFVTWGNYLRLWKRQIYHLMSFVDFSNTNTKKLNGMATISPYYNAAKL